MRTAFVVRRIVGAALVVTAGVAPAWPAANEPSPSAATAAAASTAGRQPPPEPESLAALRAELEALRRDYAVRLATLEQRLATLEAGTGAVAAAEPEPAAVAAGASEPAAPQQPPAAPTPEPAPAGPATVEVPPGAAGAGGPSGALPVYGATAAASKIFNPDIAVIGNFLGATGSNAQSEQSTLELSEAELSLQAVVDPYARADFFLTFGPEEVGIEEGYLTFNELPGGFLGKVGKFKAAFGKVNTYHPHNLPWTDRPLVNLNLVGGDEGISQSGLALSRLIPNDLLFLEATGEVSFGGSEVFDSPRRQDLTYLGRLRAYRDLTDSANLELAGSIQYGTNALGPGSHTRLVGSDLTFRWRPLRRAIYRSFLARSELVWSRRDLEEGRADAFGFYVHGEYQFARRWFAAARYDWSERAEDASLRDEGGSFALTFWPSEFSQVRGQYRRTRYAEGETADEFLFQFLFSIGAHGAHPF